MGVVIVGAGLGGLRSAESLRANGYTGTITVVGDEEHPPYNRPPLSKEALKGGIDVEGLHFRRRASTDDVTWHLGAPVAGVDLDDRTVTLADGTLLDFDGLVIATGIRPRHLPVPGPQPAVLRTAADALHLRERLTSGASLLVVGAGFIGCEVAATARSLGCDVTVTAYDAEPMLRPLGPELGAAMRRHHEGHGVTFHLGQGVAEFHDDGVTLADGTKLVADVVIEAVGSLPNTEWLAGSSLDLTDGVLTDNSLRAMGTDAAVVAVGDVSRYPNPRFDDVPRRIEHWNLPTETGKRAGATLAAVLAGDEPPATPFVPMPAFWSDQYDISLQSYGQPALGTAVLVDADWDGDCIVEYRAADGEVVGVVGVNRTKDILGYRTSIGADRVASLT